MLDIQYTLEKLAEYRELEHLDASRRVGTSSPGPRLPRSLASLLAWLVMFTGR